MNIDKKSKILILIIMLLALMSGVVTVNKFLVQKDYDVIEDTVNAK